MPHALCSTRTGRSNPAFITPERASGTELAAAKALCEQCPMRAPCARAALRSGAAVGVDLQPLRPRTAVGVFQAGVLCNGTISATEELKQIAGVAVAPSQERAVRRPVVQGTPCKNCGEPLAPWTREPSTIPAGHVMHYGRGFCVNCRKAVRRVLASAHAG